MLTEKLLRTCAVRNVYLIVRPKKGLTPEERLQTLFDEPVFNKLREKTPDTIKKILVMEGDLSKKGIGLSEEDTELIENNVNIVFHCGASLNMDAKLGDAVITNVRGTSEILEIMKRAKNLHVFVLISTAYSNCYEKYIEEKFYEAPIDPELLIKITEQLKPNIFNRISPRKRNITVNRLMGQWPNSYVFSKAVAENLLLSKGNGLPVAVFRPAIVTSTAFEPVPGWSDSLYGPMGILLSSHCGILRVVRANGDIKSHTVPGDMCINAMLCLAWDVNNKWISESFTPPVLNFSGRKSKLLIPMKNYVDFSRRDFPEFKHAMWHQMLILTKTKCTYIIMKFLLHTIPAYLIDSILVISCKKPRMKKIYAKLEKNVRCAMLFSFE
ncbi:hypothetical protein NQ317_013146 [Molorchus minor]|uniref:Fatty acyl-CoA reductase n=1 Tax=Molorchus minor TaxID=1323400 RepID=A0ABQ9JL36_9CUCU|nr:hypothetical protein NQ317_013146 [Molorchus minor]